MIVIWLPMPAMLPPNHNRANAGLRRSGVKSTRWLRRGSRGCAPGAAGGVVVILVPVYRGGSKGRRGPVSGGSLPKPRPRRLRLGRRRSDLDLDLLLLLAAHGRKRDGREQAS